MSLFPSCPRPFADKITSLSVSVCISLFPGTRDTYSKMERRSDLSHVPVEQAGRQKERRQARVQKHARRHRQRGCHLFTPTEVHQDSSSVTISTLEVWDTKIHNWLITRHDLKGALWGKGNAQNSWSNSSAKTSTVFRRGNELKNRPKNTAVSTKKAPLNETKSTGRALRQSSAIMYHTTTTATKKLHTCILLWVILLRARSTAFSYSLSSPVSTYVPQHRTIPGRRP